MDFWSKLKRAVRRVVKAVVRAVQEGAKPSPFTLNMTLFSVMKLAEG